MLILAIDPSGNYNEGKGVSGYCLLKKEEGAMELVKSGTISARNYPNANAYYGKHVWLIEYFFSKTPDLHVVMEDFFLYSSTATALINSKMETSQLLGILKFECDKLKIPYTLQTASIVKTRWTNAILEHKGIELPKDKDTQHIIDAIRHAVHYATFYKGDKNEKRTT